MDRLVRGVDRIVQPTRPLQQLLAVCEPPLLLGERQVLFAVCEAGGLDLLDLVPQQLRPLARAHPPLLDLRAPPARPAQP